MAKYYTCILPFVETGATEWHPTDRDFAPLSRGAFQTEEKAHDWAAEKIPGAAYTVKGFPCADCDKMHEGACVFDKYTSVGCYPIVYVRTSADNGPCADTLCAACASRAKEEDKAVLMGEVNWEDPELFCEECNERIESAYAEEKTAEG